MDIDLSKFRFLLEDEIDFLTEEFLIKYIINIRRVDENEVDKINNFFL